MIKSNVEEAKNNLILHSGNIATQLAPFLINFDNPSTNRYVEDLIKQSSFEFRARIIITDTDKKVLIDSYDQLTDDAVNIVEIDRAISGYDMTNIYMYEGQHILYAAVPIIDRNVVVGAVFMSVEADEIFDSVNQIIENLLLIFSAAVLISFFISFIFAQIISKPVERLTDSVKTITQGKYDTKVEIMGDDEIGALSEAFNIMTTKLSQVDEMRKKFVSNVSHELRTPMTSMKIVSDTLLSSPSWDEAVYREFMQDINTEIDRLNKIIDSLLYLVRIEKEDLELDYSQTYINYILEWVIKTINPIATSKNVKLDLVANQKVQMNLDQDKMQQCLLNIIGNAVKYTPEGGRVWIELEATKSEVRLYINDNGIGIPEKDIPFVFDRFYRVDEARARKTGGTGLGLSIAQQIVQLHNGTIKVNSEVNKGTTVCIYLPK
ncbi:sensor histidine kinase [Fusibacter sp. JL298sf-3]